MSSRSVPCCVPCLVPRLTPLLSLLFHVFHVIVSARICESTVRLRREKHPDENNGNHVEHVERGTTTNPKGKSRRAHLALGASGAASGRHGAGQRWRRNTARNRPESAQHTRGAKRMGPSWASAAEGRLIAQHRYRQAKNFMRQLPQDRWNGTGKPKRVCQDARPLAKYGDSPNCLWGYPGSR